MIELAIPTLPKQALDLAEKNRNRFDYVSVFSKFKKFGTNPLRIEIGDVVLTDVTNPKFNAPYLKKLTTLNKLVTTAIEKLKIDKAEKEKLKDRYIVLDDVKSNLQYLTNGIVFTKKGQQVKFGKLLNKLETQKEIKIDTSKLLGINLAYQQDMEVKAFPKNMKLVVSALPEDIIAVSTGRKWVSCTSLDKCEIRKENFKRVQDILESGAIVAYLVPPDDYEIDKPEWRKTIYRFDNKDSFIFSPALEEYKSFVFQANFKNTMNAELRKMVSDFCKTFNAKVEQNVFSITKKQHTDIISQEAGDTSIIHLDGHPINSFPSFLVALWTFQDNRDGLSITADYYKKQLPKLKLSAKGKAEAKTFMKNTQAVIEKVLMKDLGYNYLYISTTANTDLNLLRAYFGEDSLIKRLFPKYSDSSTLESTTIHLIEQVTGIKLPKSTTTKSVLKNWVKNEKICC